MKAVLTHLLDKKYKSVLALNGISLEVDAGQIYGLIGPDGAGKTTLIRILTSLIYPGAGEVSVLGLDPVRDYRKLRQKLGYMPGKFSLYQDLSVEENLELFASIYNTTITQNYHLIEDIYVQIEPFRDRKAGALSGGMKQKLALCCAMIHQPEILFLDEPTTGVDPVSRREFWEMLKKLNENGLTIFVSTPYMDEAGQCDRIGLIQKGNLLAVDSPDNITRLFTRKLYAISGDGKHKLIQHINTFPDCESVYSFGATLHYTHQEGKLNEDELVRFLSDLGHKVSIEPIEPTIEDTFMALMANQ